MNQTKSIKYTELQVGNVVRFYGARFEIVNAVMYRQDADHIAQYGVISHTMVAKGKWLDGEIITGYFGPTKDWNFQGNSNASVTIEIQ